MLRRLFRWFGLRRRPDLQHWNVTLYSRDECPSCEQAFQSLKKHQRLYKFTLDRIDVDSNPLMLERYGKEVPVIAIQGRIRFRGKLNPVLFERILMAESRRF